MPTSRFHDRVLRAWGRLAARLLVWAGVTAALAAPLALLEDAPSPAGVVAWAVAAVVLGWVAAEALLGPDVVESWKVRDGSRVLGEHRWGGYRRG